MAGRDLVFTSDAESEDLSGELDDLQRFIVRVFVRANVYDHARTTAAGATTQRLSYQLRQPALSAVQYKTMKFNVRNTYGTAVTV